MAIAGDDDARDLSAAAALRQSGSTDSRVELPGFDWKQYDQFLMVDDGDALDPLTGLRVINDLQDPARRPPPPDDDDRRYRWIDNTGAGTGVPVLDRQRFYGDADQVLFEAIDNVHKWAEPAAALACCAVTKGGGQDSFNRFHVVVIDDGMGIHESIRRRRLAENLPPWEEEDRVRNVMHEQGADPPAALLRLLVLEARGGRSVKPADRGHGLHAMEALTGQWSGSFLVASADGASCWWMARTGGEGDLRSGRWSTPGLHGVVLHATLDGRPALRGRTRPDRESSGNRTPVSA